MNAEPFSVSSATARLGRVAILWRGDEIARRSVTPETSRFKAVFAALAGAGVQAETVVYEDDVRDAVRAQLTTVDGVLVWVNPIHEGRNRANLDALLREVASRGTWVSAHPDVILEMGTKEALHRTRMMSWGCDTALYQTAEAMRAELPARLASGLRVIKRNRGNGGQGVWKVETLASATSRPKVRVLDATTDAPEELALDEFLDRCAEYFEDGCVVDQPFQARLSEGVVRCYMAGDRCAGFGHQKVKALVDVPAARAEAGRRLYTSNADPRFQRLRQLMEAEWTPQMPFSTSDTLSDKLDNARAEAAIAHADLSSKEALISRYKLVIENLRRAHYGSARSTKRDPKAHSRCSSAGSEPGDRTDPRPAAAILREHDGTCSSIDLDQTTPATISDDGNTRVPSDITPLGRLPRIPEEPSARRIREIARQSAGHLQAGAGVMTGAPGIAIDVEGLTKSFDGHFIVRDLSMRVRRGTICGFLGPNGSGKTTTMRMLTGLLTPDEGRGTCLGYDIRAEFDLIKRDVGYMTQRFSLYQDLSVQENLEFVARVYGVHNPVASAQAVAERLGLKGREKQLAGELSGGWKQRLALGACTLPNPRLLLLDEPTSGVDPKARREFWNEIHALAGNGLTVLVSTHYMDEAERCHEIAYIADGVLLTHGTVEEMIARAHLAIYTVSTANGEGLAKLAEELAAQPGIDMVESFGPSLHVAGRNEEKFEVAVEPYRKHRGVIWVRSRPSLEDVFIDLKGRARDYLQ